MVYVGSCDGNLYALDAATGAKIWSYKTGDQVCATPTVEGGIVYVVSFDQNMYALDAKTGTKIWSFKIGITDPNSSPAISNGIVYVGGDTNVHALNAKTGAKVWSFTTSGRVLGSPAISGGVVYIGSMDSTFYALNAATGAQIWSYRTGPIVSSPAIADGFVYVGSFGVPPQYVYAFRAPSFSIIPAQAIMRVVQGGSNAVKITVSLLTGIPEPVQLSVSGLPNGVTAAFSNNPVTPTATVTLNITASYNTLAGRYYRLILSGTSGGITETTTISLWVDFAPE
jgi:outer membrane protein assembly factor BamB